MSEGLNHGWVTGWERGPNGWQLQRLHPEGFGWKESLSPAHLLLKTRAFEPSLRPFSRLPGGNFRFDVEDLSQLPALLGPGELIGSVIPAARRAKHAIFVMETNGETIFVPAMLLIRELWYWSKSAGEILLTPNGLDIHVSNAKKCGEAVSCSASPTFVTGGRSEPLLRRLTWLSQCEDARRSWNSVLSNAHLGQLNLTLPKARARGWAWGVEVSGGLLAAELMSVEICFSLPYLSAQITIGKLTHACPGQPCDSWTRSTAEQTKWRSNGQGIK